MSLLVKQEPSASVAALSFPGGGVALSSAMERLQGNCDSGPKKRDQ